MDHSKRETLIMNGQPGTKGLSLEEVEALMNIDDDEAWVESLRLAEEKDMDIDDEHDVLSVTLPLENALSMAVKPPTPATDMEQQGQGFHISFIPFRHRTSQPYGITRDTFRLRWTSPDELHDTLELEEFDRQLLNALFEGVQRYIQQFDPNDFFTNVHGIQSAPAQLHQSSCSCTGLAGQCSTGRGVINAPSEHSKFQPEL
ncbi:uncharacterized protein [Montipora capricornis]|uniref:uncharacterized protein n=1 Tax=Montipora capricornis TaxID=246305 RepID=UPI0035F1D581